MTINLNLLATLALATALFFVGQLIVARSAVLQRYSIPVPVVGGFLFAVVLALAGLVMPVQFTMDESLKDPLLLAFFATLGLGADVRSLARGGRKLVILLVLFVLLMAIQNAIGITMARLLDLHPLVGLLGGSISLTGGHGTAAAYAASFGETRNLQGAMELGMAAATAGLILGSLLSGPVAERLMRRARARASGASGQAAAPETAPENPFFMPITTEQLLFVLLVCLVCIGVAHHVHALMKGTGILLPDFLWALLVGMVVRNLRDAVQDRGHQRPCRAGGWRRVALAVPDHGADVDAHPRPGHARRPDAADHRRQRAGDRGLRLLHHRARDGQRLRRGGGRRRARGGGPGDHGGAMSVMQTLTQRHGPAPLAFLLIPIVGAFFADIANALVLQAYFALPALGF